MASAEPVSFQELLKKPLPSIPMPYVQPDIEPFLVSDGSSLPTIPVVNMNELNMEKTKHFELQRLHSIGKEWGIFQLVNHGVSSFVMEKLKYEIGEFYKLPVEERFKYKPKPGDFEGYGQNKLVSQDLKVDWGDRFYMITNPSSRRNPNLLPQLPSSLRDALESYFSELQKLANCLFRLIAEALRIDKKEMEELFENGMQSMMMTYYPPCPQPELALGLTAHSDATGITIVHQVNGVEGLQVKKDVAWIPVNFLPDAFVVNLGDILEILSNGLYNSIEHRAAVNSEKERISIAMFFNPKFEAKIGPAASLITPQNPPLFKGIGMEEYLKDFFSQKPNGKTFLGKMKIKY